MANRRYIDFPIASTSGDTDIILIWQDGANKQTTKATFLSGLPTDLEDLNDVVISGLTNGQILRYDSVTGKWENTDQGNLDLNDLNDVSIVSPSNGQVLVYNSSTSQWENSSGGYVPYVGAVTTVDLGAQGLRAGYVRFDTTVAGVPNEQGLMFWDADDETVDIILNGYTMKIGEDLFYPVKNQTGSTIAKGVAVRFNGTVGNSGRLLIAPFIADGSVASSRFMGVTAEEILNGEDGKVLYFGRVRGINTNAFNEGDILYASTTVAGGYQTAIPVAPNNIVQVAAVVTKSATVGTIFVRPTLGSNINKDEGVKIVSVADKNLLQYQSGTSLWENKSLAQVLGGTSAQFVKGDGSLDSTSYGTGTVTSVGLSSATSGVTIGSTPVTTSGTITLAIATASGSQNGLLSSTDWTIFNNKQNALTNPVTGTGTTNYLAKFTGSTTIGNSLVFDDGTNVGIGTITPGSKFDVTNTVGTAYDASNTLVSGQTMRIANLSTSSSIASTLLFIATGGGGGNGLGTISGVNTATGSLALTFGTRDSGGSVTERARITSGGNLLVGTTTDNGARLQVSGEGRFKVSTDRNLAIKYDTNITISAQSDTGAPESIRHYADTFRIYTATTAVGLTERFTISNTGNVQIGNDSNPLLEIANGGSTDVLSGIRWLVGGTRVDYGGIYSATSSVNNNYISFYTKNSASATTERMRITSSGSVGIGTTTPDVTGFGWRTLTIRGGTTSGEAGVLELQSPTTTGAANLGIIAFMDGSNRNAQIGVQRDVSTLTSNMFFFTNAGAGIIERMQIKSSGAISVNSGRTDYHIVSIKSNSTNTYGGFGVYSSSNDRFISMNHTGSEGFIETENAGSGVMTPLTLKTGGASRLTISSTGSATFSSLGTGTVTATAGTLSTVSDLSYKIDDGFIDSAIEKVLSLKPRYFYWNEKSGLPMDIRQLGFYAQEVNEALGEEAANKPKNDNTPWGISDRSIIAMLTKAIQELKQEIDTLKN